MKKIVLIASLLFLITSCKVFMPSQMLRTGSGYKYTEFTDSDSVQEYKIAANDKLSFKLSTNDGEKLIDPVSATGTSSTQGGSGATFTVDFDGTIRLPVIGRIKVSGLTVRETEKMLEENYAKFYNNPFVQVEVTNMRVILFAGGEGSAASVITLTNTHTTLFEALATAGGIGDGKAYRIKLIRGDLKNPKVYLIDLSTLDGMKKANLVLQANDIIYIDPRYKINERFMTFVTPYISMISFILLILQTVK